MDFDAPHSYHAEIDAISDLKWESLSEADFIDAAWAYYFFSVQFRENLLIARRLHPDDEKLQHLESEECNTDNLAPWPGVAEAGEKMNHDEFMLRTLRLSPISDARREAFEAAGERYLALTRGLDDETRALSIASYEDGGLERTFTAMLRAPESDNATVRAFRHFLSEHIRFDSDPEQGHGALSRHLAPDDRILPLWQAFRQILVDFVPAFGATSLQHAAE
jgi:hypothetical protein